MKYITDYGVLMDLFIHSVVKRTPDLAHKSFIKKIQNKLDRYHKRRLSMCQTSELRVKRAVTVTEEELRDMPSEISIGAIIWLIHNRHKDILKPYNFDPKSFEDMNKYFHAQGVIMATAKVLNRIEEHMYDGADEATS